MTSKELLDKLTQTEPSPTFLSQAEKCYGPIRDPEVKRLLSLQKDALFFDDCRLLSHDEILHASEQLHVDFPEKGILPLIDCGDNDFIVFHLKTGRWSRFNIVDESTFMERDFFKALLV